MGKLVLIITFLVIAIMIYAASGGSQSNIGGGSGTIAIATPVISPNPFPFDVDLVMKGPNPSVDIRRYNSRSVNTAAVPQIPGITANCTNGLAVITLSSASTFQNGDGVVAFLCGAPHAMITPAGVTVTPSVAKAMTGTGIVATGPTAATTYNYQVIARNTAGGLTAASSIASTAVGQASLGSQTVAITSIAKSGNVNTVTTSAPHGLSVSSMVEVFQTGDDLNFGGYFVVLTVSDNTHFTYQNNYDTANGAAASTTGGTAKWYNCNRVAWSTVVGAWVYYIYGRTGGSLTLLGTSKPSQLFWDDFGSPMMDNQVFPYFVPTTPPGAATSNHLVTTIASGAGTTTLTLASAAGTTVSGATILFDNASTIALAIATQSTTGGTIYIPVGNFVINSYLTIPSLTAISQAGGLVLNDTIEVGSATRWFGNLTPQRGGPPQFAFEGLIPITAGRAPLALYTSNALSLNIRGVQITAAPNGIGHLFNGAIQTTWEDVTFTVGGSGANDYMSQGLVGIALTDVFFNTMRNVTFLAAQGNNTKTPLLFFDYSGAMKIRNISMSGRGLHFGSVTNLEIDDGRNQASSMPFLTVGGSPVSGPGVAVGPITIRNIELDTMAEPLVDNLFWNGLVTTGGQLTIDNAGYPSFNGVSIVPNVAGVPFFSVLGIGNAGAVGNVNVTSLDGKSLGVTGLQGIIARGPAVSGYGLTIPPAPTVAISGGVGPAANTYYYNIYAVDAFPAGGGGGAMGSGLSASSLKSAPITVNGSQGVLVSWTPIPGQVTTIVCRNTSPTINAGCPDSGNGFRVTGSSYLDTGSLASNGAGPVFNGLSSGFTSSGMETQTAILTNGSFKNTISGTFTANRTTAIPDGASATAMTVNFTTAGATTSDVVTVTGMTASGHCAVSPSNALAATGFVAGTTWADTPATNAITLHHTNTNGQIFTLTCTPN